MKSRLAFALALTLLVTASSARAGITYSDGMSHTINGASPDVTLSNNTTLLVVPGAAIVGGAGAVGISGTNSTVVLSGGSVTGGALDPVSGSPQDGIDLRSGAFSATGGSVTGGPGAAIGGNGLSAIDTAVLIAAGNFSAGSGTSPQYGLTFNNTGFGSLLSISGGTFTGGGPGGSEAALLTLDLTTASISGGAFQGAGATQSIGATLSDGAKLDISGGTFGGRIFASTLVGGGALDFFGTGLQFTPLFSTSTSVQGTVSGTLSGGQTISQQVFFVSPGGVQINSGAGELSFVGLAPAVAVPEPASVLLMAVGLAVVGLASRRGLRRPDAASWSAPADQ